MEKKEENKRHQVIWKTLRPVVAAVMKCRFGYTYKMAENLPENYIVLSNHVTDYDPLFVASSFRSQMYYVASEHISRWGWLSDLINYLVAPITRKKGMLASSAVMEMMRKVYKGYNVCMFAEGVRSWDGRTCEILPATAKLIKKAGCGLVTYKISGGYFVSPMWSGASIRRGKISGAPVNVYTKEQLAQMSVDEIYAAINTDLHEDAYETQLAAPKRYKGKCLAEGLENLMFICPECGKIDTFRSQNDTISCSSCGHSVKYDEYGMLNGGMYHTLREFSDWQKKLVKEHVQNGVEYTAEDSALNTVENKEEAAVASGKLRMNREVFQCGETEIPMSEIMDLAMHGQRTIVFSAKKKYYELKVAKGYNALKFMLYFNECRA